ncbi:nucleotidyltransferase domain-containing protein [Hydrogenimonas cancrithermarum]|uniref:Nucleotidyltransferase family protein n=1 Tax=Hydrogenimonas cancrithermarum TaxID=2993563 RepID=A0ABM8FJE1_9BACT|nr:nucleotidyltransferase family protein [Hydrogenimonas cancrithermarum]BDY12402.1 hypothetical protein HCR_07140 [Hydrogenimonas cancrithermarum]
MDNRKEIIQLCKLLSLGSDAEKEKFEKEISEGDIDWVKLVGVANGNFLTPALYHALESKKLFDLIDDPLLEGFLKEVYRNNAERNEGILGQLEDIQKILAPAGIKPLLLKGAAVISEKLYPAPGIRTMTDIDIMMHPEVFQEGLALLKKRGYIEFGRDLGRWHHHTPRINKKGFPAAVEPHFRVIFDQKIEYIPYDEVTSQRSRNRLLKDSNVLKPTWHLYHTFLHSAVVDKSHQRWKLALKNVYDFSVLASSYGEEIDWNLLYSLAEKYHHEKILEDFLYLAEKLFMLETPIPTNALRGWLFYKKCLWESTLIPETKIHKLYTAYTDFKEIYSYSALQQFYGLQSRVQYPFALIKYFSYHGKKHLLR